MSEDAFRKIGHVEVELHDPVRALTPNRPTARRFGDNGPECEAGALGGLTD